MFVISKEIFSHTDPDITLWRESLLIESRSVLASSSPQGGRFLVDCYNCG